MMKKCEVEYPHYGKCLEISNEVVRLVITLDFGPRIIRYSFLDGENIMFEDRERVFFADKEEIQKAYGSLDTWFVYGGHRLWTSPEAFPRTYYPDNDPVTYKITEKGAIFTPPVQKWNQYAYQIEVELEEGSSHVKVHHTVTSHAPFPVTLAPWSISVLSAGGVEVVPQPTRKTFTLPNRHITFWDYARIDDDRVTWLDRYIILRQDGKADRNFKFGINSEHGWALYFNHGDLFVKRFEAKEYGAYPDGGMSFETYTNPLFLEMESLGELACLSCGESTTHTEDWYLYKSPMPELTDEALDRFIPEFVK